MQVSLNKKSLFSLLLGLMFVFALTACGSDPVEEFLNDYEKFVVKYEELAKKDTLTMEEFNTVAKEAMEFGTKAQKMSETKPTDAQVKRATELSQRLVQAAQKLQSKISN